MIYLKTDKQIMICPSCVEVLEHRGGAGRNTGRQQSHRAETEADLQPFPFAVGLRHRGGTTLSPPHGNAGTGGRSTIPSTTSRKKTNTFQKSSPPVPSYVPVQLGQTKRRQLMLIHSRKRG